MANYSIMELWKHGKFIHICECFLLNVLIMNSNSCKIVCVCVCYFPQNLLHLPHLVVQLCFLAKFSHVKKKQKKTEISYSVCCFYIRI